MGPVRCRLASACRTGHPVDDQLYVILARRHAARLLTRDRRLAELAGQLDVALVLMIRPRTGSDA
jgi:predicted nucleic acid-binding protein